MAYFDGTERALLCSLLREVGPEAPVVPEGWRTRHLAAHLYIRDHDKVAGMGAVVPGAWARYGERRLQQWAASDYETLVSGVENGPTGLFRTPWFRRVPNLNEYFVHHEDVRRANGLGPRDLGPGMDDALWSNARTGGRLLTRRVRGATVELHDTRQERRAVLRTGGPVATLHGTPGELLLHLFGRRDVAEVDVDGPGSDALLRAPLGM